MVKQTRFIKANTGAITTSANLDMEIQAQRAHNIHGLRFEVNIESEVEEANSNGWWDVYLFPGDIIDKLDLPQTWANMDDEKTSQYLWGTGLWMASNQTPYYSVFTPATSRNITKGGRLFFRVHVEGTLPILSNNRVNMRAQYFADQ